MVFSIRMTFLSLPQSRANATLISMLDAILMARGFSNESREMTPRLDLLGNLRKFFTSTFPPILPPASEEAAKLTSLRIAKCLGKFK